uniref:DUF547 domain-containing protein n=1 Tax=Arundo donax TaxID=35708 RepID=A0A0A9CWG8_ARUDO
MLIQDKLYVCHLFQAFLQHGLPPSPDKLLALLNQASANVGGTVLNVLSIEHLILRHSPEGKQVRKMNLRHYSAMHSCSIHRLLLLILNKDTLLMMQKRESWTKGRGICCTRTG